MLGFSPGGKRGSQLGVESYGDDVGRAGAQRSPSAAPTKDAHVMADVGLRRQSLHKLVGHRYAARGAVVVLISAH